MSSKTSFSSLFSQSAEVVESEIFDLGGADVLAIKALGGWKTWSMVQRYAHLSPGHQRNAIERAYTAREDSERLLR